MKRELNEFIINLFISSLIGIIVGFVEITITTYSPEYTQVLIRDGIIGLLIGTVSRYLFLVLYAKKENVLLCFVIVFITIGVLSLVPFIYFTIIGRPFSLILLAAVLLIAEFLGMGLCYISYKRAMSINKMLLAKRRKLEQY